MNWELNILILMIKMTNKIKKTCGFFPRIAAGLVLPIAMALSSAPIHYVNAAPQGASQGDANTAKKSDWELYAGYCPGIQNTVKIGSVEFDNSPTQEIGIGKNPPAFKIGVERDFGKYSVGADFFYSRIDAHQKNVISTGTLGLEGEAEFDLEGQIGGLEIKALRDIGSFDFKIPGLRNKTALKAKIGGLLYAANVTANLSGNGEVSSSEGVVIGNSLTTGVNNTIYGAGIEVPVTLDLSKNLSLFADFGYRIGTSANFKDADTSVFMTYNGSETRAEGIGIVKDGSIDLNGPSVSLGVKYRF